MIKAILVDDEIHALEALEWDLQQYCPEVDIVGSAQDPIEGIRMIRSMSPDVVFLDIEMPKMNAFQMLDILGEPQFHVIFTTAYDEYAVKAFRVSAVDYLLKPVNKEELRQAIDRLLEERTRPTQSHLKVLRHNLQQEEDQTIVIPTVEGFEFIPVRDIVYCASDSNYTHMHLHDRRIVVSKTLKRVAELLPAELFFRTHQSFLINVKQVKKYLKGDATLVMSNGDRVDVSRSRKDALMRVFGL